MSIEYAKVINRDSILHQEEVNATITYFKDLGVEDFIPICIKITENVIATGSSAFFGSYYFPIDDEDMKFKTHLHTIRSYILLPLLKDHFKKGKMPIILFEYKSRYCCMSFIDTALYIKIEVQKDSLLNC